MHLFIKMNSQVRAESKLLMARGELLCIYRNFRFKFPNLKYFNEVRTLSYDTICLEFYK